MKITRGLTILSILTESTTSFIVPFIPTHGGPFRIRRFATVDDAGEPFDHEISQETTYIPTKIPDEESPYFELGFSFQDFLSQVTVQSFLFLLKECRDPHTLLWVEKFTQPMISKPPVPVNSSQAEPVGSVGASKLLTYHGLGAMNKTAFPTWESYFAELLKQKKEYYLIEGTAAHIPDYEIDVNPPSLCSRMISVREQIASEIARDLSFLSKMGPDVVESYWEGLKNNQEEIGLGNLLFLEWDPTYGAMPSPLRRGNFDLLVLLTTQESIHCILNEEPPGDDDGDDFEPLSQSNQEFLARFYLDRLVSHFTGRQRYNRAEAFLKELLLSAPGIDNDNENWVDPTFIAEEILKMRERVCRRWAGLAENVPSAHTEIKKLQLDLLMKSYSVDTDDAFQ